MTQKRIAVDIPAGRKALIVTDIVRYDEKGNLLGREVIEVEKTYSAAEVQRLRQILGCPECGGIGTHTSYFVRTGQNGFGDVEGYSQKCSGTYKL